MPTRNTHLLKESFVWRLWVLGGRCISHIQACLHTHILRSCLPAPLIWRTLTEAWILRVCQLPSPVCDCDTDLLVCFPLCTCKVSKVNMVIMEFSAKITKELCAPLGSLPL